MCSWVTVQTSTSSAESHGFVSGGHRFCSLGWEAPHSAQLLIKRHVIISNHVERTFLQTRASSVDEVVSSFVFHFLSSFQIQVVKQIPSIKR